MGNFTWTIFSFANNDGYGAHSYSTIFPAFPKGLIGAFGLGPIPLTVSSYKATIDAVYVNGVLCERAAGPDPVWDVVLPFDTRGGWTHPDEPVTVGVPEWAINNGAPNVFQVDLTRLVEPEGDPVDDEVHLNVTLFGNWADDQATHAPLWTWGCDHDGQQGIGGGGTPETMDNPTPLSSADLDDPYSFDDAVDIAAAGSGGVIDPEEPEVDPSAGLRRALLRRAIDNHQYAAGADLTTFTRSGDANRWTKPTVTSFLPFPPTTREVWGLARIYLDVAHAMGMQSDGGSGGSLFGWGDPAALGADGAGGSDPVFTELNADNTSYPWIFTIGAQQVYVGDGFTLISSLTLGAGNQLWGSGDASLMDGGGDGTRFGLVYDGDGTYVAVILPNFWGEHSGGRHTVFGGRPFYDGIHLVQQVLLSFGANDKGQCGRGSVSPTLGVGLVTDFWTVPGGTHVTDTQYVSCGWKGTTVLLARGDLEDDDPDHYQVWSWGYPHPLGDADGVGLIDPNDDPDDPGSPRDDYTHTPTRIPLPDLSRPNDIPPPDPADYDYEGGDVDYANDLADWEARPPLVYDIPFIVQHARGHRVMLTRHAIPDPDTGLTCYDVWTQGWNDHGQRGDGSVGGGYESSWTRVLSIAPIQTPGIGIPKFNASWDTNYVIGWPCEIEEMSWATAHLG